MVHRWIASATACAGELICDYYQYVSLLPCALEFNEQTLSPQFLDLWIRDLCCFCIQYLTKARQKEPAIIDIINLSLSNILDMSVSISGLCLYQCIARSSVSCCQSSIEENV